MNGDHYGNVKAPRPVFTHYPGNCLHCYCGDLEVNGIAHKVCCMCGTRVRASEVKS